MIISYSRKFIFIKTKKTAGTTVEAVLATGCGPEDIIPKVYGDTYPGSGLVIPGRQNLDTGEEESSDEDEEGSDKNGFNPHMTAKELKQFVGRKFWKSAFKVTVERHPYEKAVSQAYYRMFKRNRREEPFEVFLDRTVRQGDYCGYALWSIRGKPVVDEFIRQETLAADLERVTERLGFPMPKEIPEMKARTRDDRRAAHEILSDAQKEIVYEHCKREFEILGYER